MLRLQKNQTRSPVLSSRGEGVKPSPRTTVMHGRQSLHTMVCRTSTLHSSKGSQMASISAYPKSSTHMPRPTTPQSTPYSMYIAPSSRTSSRQADTSARSHVRSWRPTLALFNHLCYHSFPKCQSRANTGQYTISHPHSPSSETTSINTHIDSNRFPCTWGTFATVALLIACLPLGAQASIRDVAEAYRTIPAAETQWLGMVICLQADNQFAVNTCNNFSLASARGVYGMVADAGADIFRSSGIGPLAKWVDDHIFFWLPCTSLPEYNERCVQWCSEIQTHGGCRQDGGRIWYGGKDLPNGSQEEFDEDCSTALRDLAGISTRLDQDQEFSYTDADIDRISARLRICWEPSKSVPFGTEVPYIGFRWNLHTCIVHLLEGKRTKYLAAIREWEKSHMHNLSETQKLYGKLLHASLVICYVHHRRLPDLGDVGMCGFFYQLQQLMTEGCE
jgi:hypothetical protein